MENAAPPSIDEGAATIRLRVLTYDGTDSLST